jgi:hypothetical protein
VNGAIVEDLVSVTAQLQLDDAASPVVADGAATAAAPESESDVTPPIDAAAEPESRMSFYEGSVIAVWPLLAPRCGISHDSNADSSARKLG